jgi:conjugative transposon TraM protein
MKNYLNRNWPLLFLPLVMIPFIVLIFYILGGGSAPAEQINEDQPTSGHDGINYRLPEADRTIGIVDKMEAAQSQSDRIATRDYHIETDEGLPLITFGQDSTTLPDQTQNQKIETLNSPDPRDQEHLMAHIKRQEAQVKLEMEQATKDTATGPKGEISNHADRSGMVKDTASKSKEFKSQGKEIVNHPSGIEEVEALYNKSLALARQNDSLSFRLKEANQREEKRAAEQARSYSLDKTGGSLSAKNKSTVTFPGAIRAEIYETATVLTGNRVKIRLLEDTRLNGREVRRNTFVYGICRTDNERLQIEVQQVQTDGQFLPVKITVCDLDGLPGLYVPDNALRKVTKEVGGSANTSSMMGFTGNPLTYAGVQAADRAARTVLQVVKQKKVTIKKNTLVYLINKTK